MKFFYVIHFTSLFQNPVITFFYHIGILCYLLYIIMLHYSDKFLLPYNLCYGILRSLVYSAHLILLCALAQTATEPFLYSKRVFPLVITTIICFILWLWLCIVFVIELHCNITVYSYIYSQLSQLSYYCAHSCKLFFYFCFWVLNRVKKVVPLLPAFLFFDRVYDNLPNALSKNI